VTRLRSNSATAIVWATMLRELMDGHSTAKEIAEATGARHETVLAYLRIMRRHRVIHVARWVEDTAGRRTTAAYGFGDKPDAARQPMPRNEIKRRYRQRSRVAMPTFGQASA